MSWARYITGWARLEISGPAPERLLQALAERGVIFWHATPPVDYAMTVDVPQRAVKGLGDLAAGLGCECTVQSQHGLPALWAKIRRRYGLLACFALVLAVLYVGSAYIWQIDVTGNETIPDGVIRQALQACGVDIGSYWPAMSQDMVRNGVILRVPGIRWMTVTVRGGHAKVIVREAREHLPLVDRKELTKVVAVKAGLVEKVEPLRGSVVTEPGSAVLPGEELIGGYATGRFSVVMPTKGMGRVTARTWYELTAKSPTELAVKTPDGRERTCWALIIGKTRINFYKDSSICPAGCDKIITSHTLGHEGLFTLPITLEKTVYTGYKTAPVRAAELREDMQAQLMDTLLAKIGQDGQVLASSFTASEADGVLYVTLRAECREQIGAEVPLTAEDLAAIQAKIPAKEEKQ